MHSQVERGAGSKEYTWQVKHLWENWGRVWQLSRQKIRGQGLFITGFQIYYRNKFSVGKQLTKVLLRLIRWKWWNRAKTTLDYDSLCKARLGRDWISSWGELNLLTEGTDSCRRKSCGNCGREWQVQCCGEIGWLVFLVCPGLRGFLGHWPLSCKREAILF